MIVLVTFLIIAVLFLIPLAYRAGKARAVHLNPRPPVSSTGYVAHHLCNSATGLWKGLPRRPPPIRTGR